jgi:hypothetical protein
MIGYVDIYCGLIRYLKADTFHFILLCLISIIFFNEITRTNPKKYTVERAIFGPALIIISIIGSGASSAHRHFQIREIEVLAVPGGQMKIPTGQLDNGGPVIIAYGAGSHIHTRILRTTEWANISTYHEVAIAIIEIGVSRMPDAGPSGPCPNRGYPVRFVILSSIQIKDGCLPILEMFSSFCLHRWQTAKPVTMPTPLAIDRTTWNQAFPTYSSLSIIDDSNGSVRCVMSRTLQTALPCAVRTVDVHDASIS